MVKRTVKEIADDLDVTKQAILQRIDSLDDSKFNLDFEKGNRGAFLIPEVVEEEIRRLMDKPPLNSDKNTNNNRQVHHQTADKDLIIFLQKELSKKNEQIDTLNDQNNTLTDAVNNLTNVVSQSQHLQLQNNNKLQLANHQSNHKVSNETTDDEVNDDSETKKTLFQRIKSIFS